MNREKIYQALFDQVKDVTLPDGAPAFVKTGRRFRIWGDVPRNERPALFLRQRTDEYARPAGPSVPQKVTLDCELWIYTFSDPQNAAVVPAIQMNDLLDLIDTALAPSPLIGVQQLGGIVQHCWIEGPIVQDNGDLDGDGVATIPIKILVPL
jgi:hypothetical protein